MEMKCLECGIGLHPKTEMNKHILESIHYGQCDEFQFCWKCMDKLEIKKEASK